MGTLKITRIMVKADEPMTLLRTWNNAIRFPFALVPIEAIIASIQVPILAPITRKKA